MRPELTVLNGKAVGDELLTEILKAGSISVRIATRALEKDLEAQTRAATNGNAWRAWKSEVYPTGDRPAYNPSGDVFGNGGRRTQGMLNYWSLPGTNRAVGGKYLAVPLRAALGTNLGRRISPAFWEFLFNAKLRPLFRPGKTPLLVADGVLGPGGFTAPGPAAAMRRGGQRIGRVQTVAVFALVDEQPHANRVSISAAMQRAERRLANEYVNRLAKLT